MASAAGEMAVPVAVGYCTARVTPSAFVVGLATATLLFGAAALRLAFFRPQQKQRKQQKQEDEEAD